MVTLQPLIRHIITSAGKSGEHSSQVSRKLQFLFLAETKEKPTLATRIPSPMKRLVVTM